MSKIKSKDTEDEYKKAKKIYEPVLEFLKTLQKESREDTDG